MRPNSKTYNADFGSSFQRQSYRTFQAKPKTADLDRWDHSGYDQLQHEHPDKSSKFPRNRKNQVDNTMAADSIDNASRGRGFNQEKVRWAHDKYQETVDDASELKGKEESGVKETVLLQEAKTKKRPDRQLYSVRQKYSMKNEETKKTTTTPSSEKSTCKREEASPCPKGAKDILNILDEKEVHFMEDDKLSISNVSTAMSRNWEEESYLKSEFLKDRVDLSDLTHSPKDKESAEVILEIVLEGEQGANRLKIYYQGEEDYEIQLDSMCNKSNFDARTSLYFKINMMQMIIEAGYGNEKASATLERLLDTNYKILMYESGNCEADESIASYLENECKESESILENLEDSY